MDLRQFRDKLNPHGENEAISMGSLRSGKRPIIFVITKTEEQTANVDII